MKQVLFNQDLDNKIVINIESNTILPGSYINADYKSQDYQILEIENLIERLGVNRAESPKTEIKSKFITNTKFIITYDDVVDHFKETPDNIL